MSRQVNFYHPRFRPVRRLFPAWAGLAALAGLLALFAGAHAYGRLAQAQAEESLAQAQAREAQLAAEIKALTDRRRAIAVDPALNARAEQLERRLADLAGAEAILASGGLGSAEGFAEAFRGLARATRPGVWLTGVRIEGRDRGMSLEGRTLSGDGVTQYLQALRAQPQFSGVNFAALTLQQAVARRPGTEPAEAGAEPPPAPYLEFALKARREAGTGGGGARP